MVDFPLPVPPVININPFFDSVNFTTISGNPSDSIFGISYGNLLNVATIFPLCLKKLTLKRLTPGMPIEKSISIPLLNFSVRIFDKCSDIILFKWSGDSFSPSIGIKIPFCLILGCVPTERCKSLALLLTTCLRSSSSLYIIQKYLFLFL